jgi:UDP-N-acetylmuramate dehydrogenase
VALADRVPLGPLLTMGVGGPARWFAEAVDEGSVLAVSTWAAGHGLAFHVLGGGSNLVVADQGVDGVVLRIGLRGITVDEAGGEVVVTAQAGEPWDALVAHAVERGWAGLECLSGIPGLVGATPIQNVGAYGQEVRDTIREVRAFDRRTGRIVRLAPADCGFAYRDSLFRSRDPGRYIILSVSYRLSPGGAPTVRYPELAMHLLARGLTAPTLPEVRESVLEIRRRKSMVLDPRDPNRRSCGSFFTNPRVSPEVAAGIVAVTGRPDMPQWPEPDGRVKLSAGWLILQAGFQLGERHGAAGLSTRHPLAIVAHDGAHARDVLGFARRVRDAVEARCGVRLQPEPVFWGFGAPAGALPEGA